jgi:1-acyl-sn-glycerol-3-phosphate acyltransferase
MTEAPRPTAPAAEPAWLLRAAHTVVSGATRLLTLLLVGAYGRFESQPSHEPTIYFANHASHLDPLVIWAALPRALRQRCSVALSDYYWASVWLRRQLARLAFNASFVDLPGAPGGLGPHARLASLMEALRSGGSIVFFPEGKAGAGALPGPFNADLDYLARELPEARLVPVFLENSHRAMPKGSWYPVPFACGALFGAPLDRIDGESRDAFLARARAAVAALAGEGAS